MRRVIFTESQIKGLFGEEFMSYLSDANSGVEEPFTSYGTEVGLSDKNRDGEETSKPITDKIAHSRAQGYPMWARGIRIWNESTEMNEENQELVGMGKSFNMGSNMNRDVQKMSQQNPNDRMLSNMTNERGMTVNTAYMRIKRLKEMQQTDPQRFEQIQGDRMISILQNQIDNAKKTSASRKKTLHDAGFDNVYQKAGGTKISGYGTSNPE